MTNVTEDGIFITKMNQALGEQQAGLVWFFSALNIFLSITASLGNALILIALHKVSSIYPPTKLFFRCLAVTDLCVGLVVQPLFLTSRVLVPFTDMDVKALYYIDEAYNNSAQILCGVSLFISTAISVDRLLALLLGLRYRHVVTLRRVQVVIICLWLIDGSMVAISISRPWGRNIATLFIPICITLSVATSSFCYTRIHLRLRHHQAQPLNSVPQGQPNQGGIPLNIARYKKTVASVLWVQLALIVCYTPIGITVVLQVAAGIESPAALVTAHSLALFNSSLNPLLYCWKIKQVKKAVKDTLRKLYCF